MARRPVRRAGTQLKLKPADPFELIRWLARSQSDPRKAVAELVQNSLDAGARHVTVERRRLRRALCLLVRDDGEGVIPELGREEALRYIATHIGHSRKLGLDPAERARRVVAGKYGVGLLGFWCVGHRLELRSRVAGSELHALRLEEDSPDAEIVRLPLRTDTAPTETEAVVIDVTPAAARALGGRRLSEYLAAELRGQLLARAVELVVHDRVARGLAQQTFRVVPRRFVGEKLELPPALEVPGYSPIRVELYLARGAEHPAIQVACAGTLVAADMTELAALGLARDPWVGRELTGLIDFPDLTVPPGSRRGVVPDARADAFVAALRYFERTVLERLEELERRRREELDRSVLRELRRALRGFRERLPQYDLPHVEGPEASRGAGEPGAVLPNPEPGADASDELEPAPPLFPPGPLAAVRITPQGIDVAPGAERRVRALATDAEGHPVKVVELVWELLDPLGIGLSLRGEGPRPALAAPPRAALGLEAELFVTAREDGRAVGDRAVVRIARPEEPESALGIPEPRFVSDAAAHWRSRLNGERWEVNDAHEDYLALRSDSKARLRYLLALLAKEIALRSSARPDAADVLESLVEILAHAERNLRES